MFGEDLEVFHFLITDGKKSNDKHWFLLMVHKIFENNLE